MSPDTYRYILAEEIWGCVHYVGIPYDTVMSMPIAERRFYIMKHNKEQETYQQQKDKGEGSRYGGDMINDFAKKAQQRAENKKRR